MMYLLWGGAFIIVLLINGNILFYCVKEMHRLRHRKVLRYFVSVGFLLCLFGILRILNNILNRLS